MRLGRIVFFAMSALSGAIAGQAGTPRWVEVRSPHFTVYSDAGEKVAGRVARQFERFRAAIGELWPKTRLDPAIPILIFAARNEGSMKELLPEYWERKDALQPAGIFLRRTRRYYIVLRTDILDSYPREDGENPFHVLYHEYMHLVADLNFETLPTWLSEGLAEYIGATVVTDDDTAFGRPIWPHVLLLREKGLLPTAALFKIDQSSPEYNERDRSSVFYAQSWALVHYLSVDPKAAHAGSIGRLLAQSQRQAPRPEAAVSVLPDPADLDRALKSYLNRNQLPYRRVKSTAAQEHALRARELPASQLAAARGLFQADRNRPVEARAALGEALRLDPQQPDALEGLGTLALWESKLDDARRLLGEAVQLPGASAVAHYSYALVLLHDSPPAEERQAQALSSLERSVALDPAFVDALVMLAQVMANRGADVETILGLMRRAVEIEPGVFEHRLTAARLLLRCGRVEQARDLAAHLLARGRSQDERNAARSVLASLSSPAPSLARDTAALVLILETRCGWGNAQDCLDLADRLRVGEGLAADPARAAPLYEKACANEIVEACARAGWAYEQGEGVAQDAAQTAHFYEMACERGDLISCGRLGWLVAEGRLLGKDEARSLVLCGKACDGGESAACNTLGVVHMRRKEYAKAAAPLARSCEAGEAVACGNLALLYGQGLGVSRDVARALTLHKQACEAGLVSSCERLNVVR
jgi:TPR repeat protein